MKDLVVQPIGYACSCVSWSTIAVFRFLKIVDSWYFGATIGLQLFKIIAFEHFYRNSVASNDSLVVSIDSYGQVGLLIQFEASYSIVPQRQGARYSW